MNKWRRKGSVGTLGSNYGKTEPLVSSELGLFARLRHCQEEEQQWISHVCSPGE